MQSALKDLRTASIWFFRGLKHGDWLWLVFAIMIASLSVTLIKQVGDSVQQSMLAKAANSLGADLVIRSSRPIESPILRLAESFNLNTRQTTSVVTMAFANDQFQLISLKGVSKLNPIRLPAGQHPISDDFNSGVWLEPKLFELLNLKQGDDITLGEKTFKIIGQLTPNSLINPMAQFAPQALLSLENFEQTQLLGPGSRATYELQISGQNSAVLDFKKQVEQRIQNSQADSPLPWTLISAQAPSEDLGKTLDRAWFFLDLSSLSAVLIAGMSILIASRFYLRRWQNTMALLRATGANNAKMMRLFAGQLFWLSFFSSIIGALLGLLASWLLAPTLTEFFDPFILSSPWQAFWVGAMSGMLVLWSFAWQALTEAINTSPMRLLKSVPRQQSLIHWGFSLLLITLLISLMVGWDLLMWVMLGLLVLSLVFWLSATLLIYALEKLNHRINGWKKIAISNVLKEKGLLKIQLISVGIVLFVLLLMTFVRQDILQTWQNSLPENAPNVFMMNIQPDQKNEVEKILAGFDLHPTLTAMVKGRLIEKNGMTMKVSEQASPRGQRLLQREANIGIMQQLPEHNLILAEIESSQRNGALPSVSVEQSIAELFGIKLGDTLQFDFQGQKFSYQVTSFRQVEWQSFQLNFFFIIEPFSYEKNDSTQAYLPISYISNFYLPESTNTKSSTSTQITQNLAQQTPGVLLIDVSAIMVQIKDIMNQATWAVTGLYFFTLIASILVLFTATLASQQNRLQNWFLLRSLGATQKIITKIGLTEFVLTGILAGAIAATLAQITSWLISTFWLQKAAPFSFELWMTSLTLGVSVLLLIAWLTQRHFLKLSASQLKQIIQN
ncbi:ABC transporter permease [Thiomicrorhabdus indica]|uniref:ABC transporter permease n=1 Tax=Thiomicrorhabdus indica TaxID=2267253 RepID=UPI00102D8E4C|nr:FtsX-like permease family protein [Thiomicrorhabdus indica]